MGFNYAWIGWVLWTWWFWVILGIVVILLFTAPALLWAIIVLIFRLIGGIFSLLFKLIGLGAGKAKDGLSKLDKRIDAKRKRFK